MNIQIIAFSVAALFCLFLIGAVRNIVHEDRVKRMMYDEPEPEPVELPAVKNLNPLWLFVVILLALLIVNLIGDKHSI